MPMDKQPDLLLCAAYETYHLQRAKQSGLFFSTITTFFLRKRLEKAAVNNIEQFFPITPSENRDVSYQIFEQEWLIFTNNGFWGEKSFKKEKYGNLSFVLQRKGIPFRCIS